MNKNEGLIFDDTEDRFRINCWACGGKHVKLTRIIKGTALIVEYVARTKNHIGICTNKKCWRYRDRSLLKYWIEDGAHIENLQSLGEKVRYTRMM